MRADEGRESVTLARVTWKSLPSITVTIMGSSFSKTTRKRALSLEDSDVRDINRKRLKTGVDDPTSMANDSDMIPDDTVAQHTENRLVS